MQFFETALASPSNVPWFSFHFGTI